MKLKTLVLSGLLIASPFCGAAFAQGTGWYVNAAYDITSISVDTTPVTAANGTVQSVDKISTGWHGALGYKLNDNWALEAGYFDAGNATVRGFQGTSGTFSARPSMKYWSVTSVYSDDINANWAWTASFGVNRWSNEWTNVGSIGAIADTDGYDINAGVSLAYKFNDKLSVSVGYNRYWGQQKVGSFYFGGGIKF